MFDLLHIQWYNKRKEREKKIWQQNKL
jgi:hypothetical protein